MQALLSDGLYAILALVAASVVSKLSTASLRRVSDECPASPP